MTKKNIKAAIKKLPKDSQQSFLELWEETGIMDLYDGDLKTYIEVITSVLTSRNNKISQLKDIIREVSEVINK
jgi:hypothetical protein